MAKPAQPQRCCLAQFMQAASHHQVHSPPAVCAAKKAPKALQLLLPAAAEPTADAGADLAAALHLDLLQRCRGMLLLLLLLHLEHGPAAQTKRNVDRSCAAEPTPVQRC
jgi:hypothetical protein